MDKRLEGKVALVTGASSGIGQATAIRLGREGAAVGVNYRSDEDGAREAVEQIKGAGGRAVGVQGDVSKEDDAKRMVAETIEAFEGLDVIVNNAGIESEAPFLEMDLEEWEKVISGQPDRVLSLVPRSDRAHGRERRRLGRKHVQRPPAHPVAQVCPTTAASKGGVKLLTETLALEFASRGVRVNAVGPGAIETAHKQRKARRPGRARSGRGSYPLGPRRAAGRGRRLRRVPRLRRGLLRYRNHPVRRRRHDPLPRFRGRRRVTDHHTR